MESAQAIERERNYGSAGDTAQGVSDGLPKRQRTIVLAVMMSGTTAACISQSMMIAALPTIMHEYSVSASLGQLLTTSYIFTLGLISAMTAYLVHRVDSKKLFIAAMVCFVAGCAAALVAPNYPLLLASRLLQAGGAGIALPLIQVVALSVYPKSEYGRAMGLVGLIIGFAPAIGPTVSGFLIDFWGWRSVFVILGAVSAVVVVLSFFVLSDVVKREASRERFDVPRGCCTRLASAASCWGPRLWSRTLRSILCLWRRSQAARLRSSCSRGVRRASSSRCSNCRAFATARSR